MWYGPTMTRFGQQDLMGDVECFNDYEFVCNNLEERTGSELFCRNER
jgi:hypothetical protein